MKKTKVIKYIIIGVILVATFISGSTLTRVQGADTKVDIPGGVHMELTKEFYESLIDKNRNGDRLYSTDPSIEHLREIAISTRFMVETNLQILKQQEMILQMLQSLLKDKKK